MPSRSNSYWVPQHHTYDLTKTPIPADVHTATNEFTASCGSSRVTGANIPGWQRLIALGNNASTELFASESRYEPGHTTIRRDFVEEYPSGFLQTCKSTAEGNIIVVGDPGIVDPGNTADNQALGKFYADARKQQTQLMALVAAGELHSTLNLLKGGARGLFGGMINFCTYLAGRGPRIAISKRKRWFTDRYLEATFGWAPFIQDIDGACRALAENANFVQQHVPVRGYAEQDFASSDVFDGGRVVGSMAQVSWGRRDIGKKIVIYRGAITRKADNPLYLASESFGFDPSNFVPSIWELIPWSFVADYFVNIDDILSAWAFHTADLSWYNRTIRIATQRSVVQPSVEFFPGPTFNPKQIDGTMFFVPGLPRWSRKDVSRTSDFEIGVPSLEFSIPGFGSRRWLNIATLARAHEEAKKAIRR